MRTPFGGEFEPRLTHGDAEGFGLGGAGDGAAVAICGMCRIKAGLDMGVPPAGNVPV